MFYNIFLGQLYLLQIFHLIRNNMDWFFGHLDIPEPLSKKEPTEKHVAFNVTAENTYKQTFNPLISFNRIGNSTFDQVCRKISTLYSVNFAHIK